ncbi:MAG: NifB/NifX family molybdenum-iron cluster-binding protein [Bacteriovoracaceae bacterium]|nr:NifB/NifX family molybdenum-iron cluster-binding protein [Bacteriovoracaceae bacterium]
MKIAIPVAGNKLCMHFGHCEVFAFFEIDEDGKSIKNRVDVQPPAHEPGVLPKWVGEQGASIVLAGGMGQRAQELFGQNGVKVIVGVHETDPQKAVLDYINNSLQTGNNVCDH